MNMMETRMKLYNLDSDFNHFKMYLTSEFSNMEIRTEMRIDRMKQSNSAGATDLLSKISADIHNDLALLKKRQDQLFYKQDQIQCTLAGETPPLSIGSGFQSPSDSSVLTWSPMPTLTPSRPLKKQQSSMIERAQQQVQSPKSKSILGYAVESTDYLYGLEDLSSLLDDEAYQSSLSDVAVAKSDLGALLTETLTELPATAQIQPTAHQSTMPRPAFTQVDNPPPASSLGEYSLVTHQPTTLSPSVRSHQYDQSMTSATDGDAALLPPSRKKIRSDPRPEDSGISTALKDPEVVVRKYASFTNVADVGKLACMLARQSFFSDDILKVSTVHGKSTQYRALNRKKLSALSATIHELPEFRDKSKQEFSVLYTPKINSSLSRLCMNLRKT